jgi:hypothetical protein
MPTEDERLIFDQSRTVSQASPRMAKMSGREVIEAIRAGLLVPPPLARLIGFQIAAIADGQVEFALEPREDLENLAGALHGVSLPRFSTMPWALRCNPCCRPGRAR